MIQRRARFLLLLEDRQFLGFDFVSEFPCRELAYVYEFLEELGVFEGYQGKQRKLYTPEDIIGSWRSAEAENERYYSDPTEFHPSEGRVPFVFNHGTLRRLRPDFIANGQVLRTFEDSQ
jgi:hypothetical protein